MPHHKSTEKRMRQNAVRRLRNRMRRSRLRTLLKKVDQAIENGDAEIARSSLKDVIPVIDKTVKLGVIHWKKGARKKSRLSKKVNQLAST